MTDLCSYHPTQTAWWYCDNCDKFLCPKCITRRVNEYQGNISYFFCPKCNTMPEQKEIRDIIPPFWKRLHSFFVYPFTSVHAISLIFGLALLASIPGKSGFLPIVLQLVSGAVMLKYAYESLNITSAGNLKPPPINADVLTGGFVAVVKQVILLILLVLVAIFIVGPLGGTALLLYIAVVSICFPSMIILLAVTNSVLRAINPVYYIGFAIRIGWAYLLLLFFLSILGVAPILLGYSFIQHMPESIQPFFFSSATNYYTLVSYHLMGYVIVQYHDRLDHEVNFETMLATTFPQGLPEQTPLQNNSGQATAEQSLLTEIGPLIQEGDLEGAIALIKERTGMEISDPELSDRYITLLKMANRDSEYMDYAPNHLELLAKSEEKLKATALYEECVKSDRDFAASPIALFKVGSWLNEKGDANLAIQALNRLTKSYPKDALVPKAYYRAAQIMHEKLKATDRAKRILTALIDRYPNHDMADFAQKYLNSMP